MPTFGGFFVASLDYLELYARNSVMLRLLPSLVTPFSLLLLLLANCAVAQSPGVFANIAYEVEAGPILSSAKSNPFWLRSNEYGEVPLESQLFTLRAQLRKDYDTTGKFSYGYGARVVANAGKATQLLLPELYAKVRYGAFELYAGRRREIIGLVDSTLSAGSYIWSGNALPIPKVQLSIPDYTPILFKNKILAVKGQFSHGWFGSGDSTSNFYLHQKSLYLRLGKPSWRFKMHGGINHQAQWGGSPSVPFFDSIYKVQVTSFGNSMEAYLSVVLGLPIDYETRTFATGGKVYGEGNRLGNHLGSLDLALEYEGTAGRWLLYRQSVYEDGSLYYLTNIADGLSGISWTSLKASGSGVKKIVVEYLYTANQGGPYSARIGFDYLRGQDNYFNNAVYNEGWVYRQQTIGTPFITTLRNSTGLPADSNELLAVNPNRIVNNRVKALTISAIARIGKIDLLSRISTSENLGSYRLDYPISERQLSLFQRVSLPIKQYTFSADVAYDGAGIYEGGLGTRLLVRRTF